MLLNPRSGQVPPTLMVTRALTLKPNFNSEETAGEGAHAQRHRANTFNRLVTRMEPRIKHLLLTNGRLAASTGWLNSLIELRADKKLSDG